MSATGLEVFDRTLQITNTWLEEIMTTLPRGRKLAWHVLSAVLRSIRDRVPINLAAHLGAQLPLLVRSTYYDQWRRAKAQNVAIGRPISLHRLGRTEFRETG